MAESAMVKEQLTPEMVTAGKNLINYLDKSEIGISSAFWFYMEDSEKWRLILSSPKVKSDGPKKVYLEIQKCIEELGKEGTIINLRDISVVEQEHSLIKLISKGIITGDGISEIRFSRNTINGHYIEDAMIYRIQD